ncbi:hypothetical protein [Streptomyces sp. SA15]|uniref:hypothetical protein n=1 Tax=Streptomyces sp. SA15 TaxID=934019 RepID=UPI0015C754BF|nr:hypothetical protein [Streptomyces sp. SA15]
MTDPGRWLAALLFAGVSLVVVCRAADTDGVTDGVTDHRALVVDIALHQRG